MRQPGVAEFTGNHSPVQFDPARFLRTAMFLLGKLMSSDRRVHELANCT